MPKAAQPTIVNIDRDKLSLCAPYHLEPLSFKFPPELVSDLEIVNPSDLNTGLRNFIELNKIKPGPLVIIVAQSVYFEKNYTGQNPPTPEEVENFIDTIPFSTVSSKLFRVISGFKQVVINRDFYESLKGTFEELGFQVIAVVPGFALGQNAIAGFTAETCRIIYRKIDQIIADSMIGAKDNTAATFHRKEQAMLESHKIIVILSTLLVLAICGGALYLTFGRPPVVHKALTANVIPQVPPEPTETPLPTPVPEAPALTADDINNLTVQILNASGKVGQAASMSAKLKSLGFAKIQIGNNAKTAVLTTLYLSPRVATAAGDLVYDSVKSIYPDAESETDLQAKFDISVIIGTSAP
jgi:hypothetical protein